MGIGFSIFLLAVGAVLAFAVNATVSGLDIHVVGYILMGAGVIGLILTMIIFTPRRRTVVDQRRTPLAGDRVALDQPVVESSTVTRDVQSGPIL